MKNIGKRIARLRKKKNITQEQLANAVGVSVPAVSKWENQITAPDISLLSPIARLLDTDINHLLGFHEDISRQEVDNYMKEIRNLCKREGFEKGMEKAFSLVREYPANHYLKLEIASSVTMNAFTVQGDSAEQQLDKYARKAEKLFEEVAYGGDDIPAELREAAIAALSSHYIQSGKLKEAEVLLQRFTRNTFDGSHMLPVVYLMQGELKESRKRAQQNLLYDIQQLMGDIRSLHSVSIREQDYEKALEYARGYSQVGQCICMASFLPSELYLDTFLKMGDLKSALIHFERYIDEILNHHEAYRTSPYFDVISGSVSVWNNDLEQDIKISLYRAVKENPSYQQLLDSEAGKKHFLKLEQSVLGG